MKFLFWIALNLIWFDSIFLYGLINNNNNNNNNNDDNNKSILFGTSVVIDCVLWVDLRPVVDGSLAEVQQGPRVVALALRYDRIKKNAVLVLWRMDRCSLNLSLIFSCDAYDWKRNKNKLR